MIIATNHQNTLWLFHEKQDFYTNYLIIIILFMDYAGVELHLSYSTIETFSNKCLSQIWSMVVNVDSSRENLMYTGLW